MTEKTKDLFWQIPIGIAIILIVWMLVDSIRIQRENSIKNEQRQRTERRETLR